MSPLIISEISGNHCGDIWKAKELIRAAHGAGCDLVKFQLYEPDDMNDPANNELYEQYKIPVWWLPELFEVARYTGIGLFASVFSARAVRELSEYPVWGYKIASPESTRLVNYNEIVTAIERTGKRFIMSSGAKDFGWAQSLNPDLLFYCVAGYPATITASDIEFVADTGGIGFSDHTNDIIAPLAMIQAGAIAIEKHFKLDDDCIDAAFSLNPTQMEKLCRIAHRS